MPRQYRVSKYLITSENLLMSLGPGCGVMGRMAGCITEMVVSERWERSSMMSISDIIPKYGAYISSSPPTRDGPRKRHPKGLSLEEDSRQNSNRKHAPDLEDED